MGSCSKLSRHQTAKGTKWYEPKKKMKVERKVKASTFAEGAFLEKRLDKKGCFLGASFETSLSFPFFKAAFLFRPFGGAGSPSLGSSQFSTGREGSGPTSVISIDLVTVGKGNNKRSGQKER